MTSRNFSVIHGDVQISDKKAVEVVNRFIEVYSVPQDQ